MFIVIFTHNIIISYIHVILIYRYIDNIYLNGIINDLTSIYIIFNYIILYHMFLYFDFVYLNLTSDPADFENSEKWPIGGLE